jgi:hypothetical protein
MPQTGAGSQVGRHADLGEPDATGRKPLSESGGIAWAGCHAHAYDDKVRVASNLEGVCDAHGEDDAAATKTGQLNALAEGSQGRGV